MKTATLRKLDILSVGVQIGLVVAAGIVIATQK